MTSNSTCDRPEGIATPEQVIATHVAGLSGKAIAAALGHADESVASKIKNGTRGIAIDELARLLALPSPAYPHGLRVAPFDGIVVDAVELRSIETLAFKWLEFRRRHEGGS